MKPLLASLILSVTTLASNFIIYGWDDEVNAALRSQVLIVTIPK